MSKPLIGILIEPFTFEGIRTGDTGREHLEFYEKAGEMYGLIPCYFRLQDVDAKHKRVRAYRKANGKYVLKTLPLPPIIHNRILIKGKKNRERWHRLKATDCIIFNRHNRFRKWTMHQLLYQNKAIRPHLPETHLATVRTVQDMMQKYKQLIIKPNNGSIGSGILKLNRIGENWQLTYPAVKRNGRIKWTVELFQRELPKHFVELLNRRNYLVQERIPLATFGGAPFDFRVSVQKNAQGEWQVTGIVGKVARKGHFLTNVARGGTTYTLEEILQHHPTLTVSQVCENVSRLALLVAQHIDQNIPRMADLGLDIGVTEEGKPYFIELNGRDLRITFRNANMVREWEETHTTPIGYAAYLLKKHHLVG